MIKLSHKEALYQLSLFYFSHLLASKGPTHGNYRYCRPTPKTDSHTTLEPMNNSTKISAFSGSAGYSLAELIIQAVQIASLCDMRRSFNVTDNDISQ